MTQANETTQITLRFKQSGDLISTNAEPLRLHLKQLQDSPPQPNTIVVLDLSSAKMVDSVGLNLIVTVLRTIQGIGGKLQIEYSNQNVYRTFVFTRLDKHAELVKIG